MKIISCQILFLLFISSISCFYHTGDGHYWSFQNSCYTNVGLSQQSNTGYLNVVDFTINNKGLKRVRIGDVESLDLSSSNNTFEWTISFWFEYNPTAESGVNIIFKDHFNNRSLYYNANNNQYEFLGLNVSQYVHSDRPNLFAYSVTRNSSKVVINRTKIWEVNNTNDRTNNGFKFHMGNNLNRNLGEIFITDLYVTNNFRDEQAAFEEYDWYENLPNNLNNYFYNFQIHGSLSSNTLYDSSYNSQVIPNYVTSGEITGNQNTQINLNQKRFNTFTIDHNQSQLSETINFWIKLDETQQEREYYTLFQTLSCFLYLFSDGRICVQPTSNHNYQSYCSSGHGEIFSGYWTNFILVLHPTYAELYINNGLVQFNQNESEETVDRLPSLGEYQNFSYVLNGDRTLNCLIDDFFVRKGSWNSGQIFEYFEQHGQASLQCAAIYTGCNFTGEHAVICGRSSSISVPFMKSIFLPPGKKITLFTGTEFTGEYQVFTESVECQDLVYIPQEEEQQ